MRTMLLILSCLIVLLATQSQAGHNFDGKVAVHVLPHEDRTCSKAFPVISYCGEIITTYEGCGDIDFFPVFFNLNGYTGMNYGMIWPGSGSCLFTSCSDFKIGDFTWSGGGMAQVWGECQGGPVGIPGWGWISCDEPGQICVVEHPENYVLSVADCLYQEDEMRKSFCAGVCGAGGMDPCEELPPYTALPVEIASGVGGECIVVGNDITYTIQYENPNPGPVSGVVLTASYSPHTVFRNASGHGQRIGDYVRWDVGNLAIGQMGSANFTVRVSEDAPLGALLGASALIECIEVPDGTAGDTTMVCLEEFAPLGLDITPDVGEGCAFVGDDMTYTISYGNSNPGAVNNVLLWAFFSPHTIFQSASGNGREIYGNRVEWNLGRLVAGEADSAHFTVRVKQVTMPGTPLPVSATIKCSEAPDGSAAGTTMVCVDELAPLGLVKDDGIGDDGFAIVGDYITYKIRFDNHGNASEVCNVRVVDDLGDKLAFVSASDDGVYDPGPGTVTWDTGTLSGGASDSVVLTTAVRYEAYDREEIINSCSVKGDETRTTRVNERTEVLHAKVALYVRPHAYWHKCGQDIPPLERCQDIRHFDHSCDVTVYPVFFDIKGVQGLEYSMVWPVGWGSCTFMSCSDATIGDIAYPGDQVVQIWNECQQQDLFIPAVCHVMGTGPGLIRVEENWGSGMVGITTCRGNKYNVLDRYPGGVCGEYVRPACGGPANVEPVTWGRLKAMFR
ncbi:MAG: hypothetical protein PVJ42_04210 [bacterium]